MIGRQKIISNINNALESTNLDIKDKYVGKVRDVYFTEDNSILVTTDRQSAFDRFICLIPFKGQVLTQLSVWWFKQTANIIKSHFVASPDPNVVVASKVEVLPVEFVVRGYITGSTSTSLWMSYKNGSRDYCGNILPQGLKKNQKLPQNILTPTTKEQDYDHPISAQEIIKQGWLTQKQWDFISQKALQLFDFGQKKALENGLILADTKYEFGIDKKTKEIILIDEIHTPDSSRFWLEASYFTRVKQGLEPENMDKEVFRLWFRENCDPYDDAKLPKPPQELVVELSQKYITLFEMITRQKFTASTNYEDINRRIIENVMNYCSVCKNKMNILLIGSGAREQAITKAIKQSSIQNKLFCASTVLNPKIEQVAEGYHIADICDCTNILKYAKSQHIDMVIIGPEAPLEVGLADKLKSASISVVAPIKKLAQLETSKSFTRDLIQDYKIGANPFFRKFSSIDGVEKTLTEYKENFVIKADGLCGGKGVLVWADHLHSIDQAVKHCRSLVDAGRDFVIEEKLSGEEFSLISLTDGKSFIHMPAIQDHKRAYEDDKGPNTGGMGAYSDVDHRLPFLTDKDIYKARRINEKIASALADKFKQSYQGVLYGSFIATKDDVKVIEYNARFGDPEAINLLALLDSDFVSIAKAITQGTLGKINAKFKKQASVCKYLVPLGYPNQSVKNFEIDISQCPDDVELFLGAVDYKNDKLIATGSRAIAVLGLGDSIIAAEKKVENAIRNIYGKLYHRPDIGTKELVNRRIKHMNMLRDNNYDELK